MKDALENNGGVTPEQIAMWKGRHRKVVSITVTDEGECHTGYFRRPDMDTMAAVAKLSKTDEVKAACALFDNCWLGGSPLMQEDAVLKMAAIGQLNVVTAGVRSEVKNV